MLETNFTDEVSQNVEPKKATKKQSKPKEYKMSYIDVPTIDEDMTPGLSRPQIENISLRNKPNLFLLMGS